MAHAVDETVKFSVNGRTLQTSDLRMTGRQIRTEAGYDPASDYVLILLGDRGMRSIGLDEMVELDGGGTAFRAFESDRVFSFTLDERGYEWGAASIDVDELRRISHVADDRELVLDDDEDVVLASGTSLDLGQRGSERIRTRRKAPRTVTIVVNGREKEIDRGPISHERIVQLAFGTEAPAVTHTVNWRRADGDEGSLLAGESVGAREGMIFTATATNRS